MQDSNEASDHDKGSATDSSAPERASSVHDHDAPEPDGWQQYRRWISKAPARRGRRTGVDPSVYTWKGYRSWAEQVKRNWSGS